MICIKALFKYTYMKDVMLLDNIWMLQCSWSKKCKNWIDELNATIIILTERTDLPRRSCYMYVGNSWIGGAVLYLTFLITILCIHAIRHIFLSFWPFCYSTGVFPLCNHWHIWFDDAFPSLAIKCIKCIQIRLFSQMIKQEDDTGGNFFVFGQRGGSKTRLLLAFFVPFPTWTNAMSSDVVSSSLGSTSFSVKKGLSAPPPFFLSFHLLY